MKRGERSAAIPGLGHLLVGQPEIAERMQRALMLKGQLPQFIEGEYNLSLTVEDLTRPEFAWLRRETRLSQAIFLPAVAAQFSQAAFAPIASTARSLAVVESLVLTNNTAAGVAFLVDSQPNVVVGAAAAVPKSALDDRAIPFNQLQPTPGFGWVSATAAGALTGAGAIPICCPAFSSFKLDLNWVFTNRVVLTTPAPSLLLVQCSVVNVAINVAAIWRERNILASEQ